jgi:hypothetical protein
MSDEQIQAWQQIQAAAQAAWDAIMEVVQKVVAVIKEWWRTLPRAVRRALALRTQPIMRRKIRRYALVYARLR